MASGEPNDDLSSAGTTTGLWIPIFTIKRRKTRRDWLFAPLTIPLAVLVYGTYTLVAGPFVVPYFLILNALLRRRERQLQDHYRRQGRFLTWDSLESRLERGEGIFVIDEGGPCWWISEYPACVQPALWLSRFPDQEHPVYLLHPGTETEFRTRYLDLTRGTALHVSDEGVDESRPWRRYPLTHLRQRFPHAAMMLLLVPRPVVATAGGHVAPVDTTALE